MKTYPARFVGEFEYDGTRVRESIPNIGDVALFTGCPDGRRRVAIACACGGYDLIPVDPDSEGRPGWRFTSREPVNIEPSLLVHHDYGQPTQTVCHYYVHGGQLQMLGDTTSTLKDVR
jgi:hypothetical protein